MCKYLFKKKSALQRDRFLWVEGLFPSRSLYLFQRMVQFAVAGIFELRSCFPEGNGIMYTKEEITLEPKQILQLEKQCAC